MRPKLISGVVGALTLGLVALQPVAQAESRQRLAADIEPRATAGTIADAQEFILDRYRDLLIADDERFCQHGGFACKGRGPVWALGAILEDFSAETDGDPDFLGEPVVWEATPQQLLISDLVNPNSAPRLMTSLEKHEQYSDTSTTSTTHGFGISGGASTARLEIPLDEGDGGLGGSLEIKYDFSTTKSQQHTVSETVIVPRQNVMVPPHSTAHVYAVLSRVRVEGLIGQDLKVHAMATTQFNDSPNNIQPYPMESSWVMQPWPDYTSQDGEPMDPAPEGWHPQIGATDDWTLVDNIARFDGVIGDGMQVMINCTDNATGEIVDCSSPGTTDGPLRLDRFVASPGTPAEQTFSTPTVATNGPESNLPTTAYPGARMKLEAAGGRAPYRYQVSGPATVNGDVLTITGPGKVDVEMTDAEGEVVHYKFHPSFFESPGGQPLPWADASETCRSHRSGSVLPPSSMVSSGLTSRHSGALVNEWGDPEKNDSGWEVSNTFSDTPYAATSTLEDGWPLAAALTLNGGSAVVIAGWQVVNVVCMTPSA